MSENQARLQQLQTDQDGLRDDLNAKDAHLKDVQTENERLNGLIKEFEELQKPGDETLVIEGDSMEQLLVNLKTVITFLFTFLLIKHDGEGNK